MGSCWLSKGLDLWGVGAVKRDPEEATQEATGRVSLGGGQKVNFLLPAGPAKACPGPLWFRQSFGTEENAEFFGVIIEA